MQFKVQPLLCANEGHEETTHEIAILEKDCQRIEYRGLTLAEAKQILSLPKIRKRRSCWQYGYQESSAMVIELRRV